LIELTAGRGEVGRDAEPRNAVLQKSLQHGLGEPVVAGVQRSHRHRNHVVDLPVLRDCLLVTLVDHVSVPAAAEWHLVAWGQERGIAVNGGDGPPDIAQKCVLIPELIVRQCVAPIQADDFL